ncbi:hypothetical protein ACOSP7_005004 [Xanthoceras sorbifolium]
MVTFIDNYSRRCWVYPIKRKSDVCTVFKAFKARVELDSEKRIKYFIGYADGVKGYHLWDPTTHKIIVSMDVIFVENQIQKEEGDGTSQGNSEITIALEENSEKEDSDSSEAASAHEAQVPVESEALEISTVNSREERTGMALGVC